jgi:hypothetical protein
VQVQLAILGFARVGCARHHDRRHRAQSRVPHRAAPPFVLTRWLPTSKDCPWKHQIERYESRGPSVPRHAPRGIIGGTLSTWTLHPRDRATANRENRWRWPIGERDHNSSISLSAPMENWYRRRRFRWRHATPTVAPDRESE